MRRLGAAALALGADLLLPGPAPAGLGEDLARCQTSVWPRFADWSLSRQQGPASFPGKDPVKAAGYARTAADQTHAGAQGLLGFFHDRGIGRPGAGASVATGR